MRSFSSKTPEEKWYAHQSRCKDSDDPDLQEQARDMDACPNNPRNGGPGFFGKNKHLDRR